ncbi:Presequence translocated-associated motor subunit pam17 [Microdochium trichocladiopsis]|uniref:Presequence translocated-associated motor subunit PAM17 n=1 Tax=Microdochium trichocladiopsis TaxID=1682393 RepID=A0A9P8Y2C6_9PEZI|nr:Presequence translocated-associated motor subunit pam17 [Microdochium trichocladiopsis]KAH7027589.1 Presequence translocated-associated motor subunit pam17 [Microdochium trichocladiopsis]
MLTSTTTAFARQGALGVRGLALQPTACLSPSARPCGSLVSSLARRQFTAQVSASSPTRHFSSKIRPGAASLATGLPSFAIRRHASTVPGSSTPTLDWNTFFTLRKTRRRFQLVSSILTTIIGGGGGAMLLVNQDLDWLLGKIPMDPFFSLGLITLSFAGLGWLAGPSLGNAIFYTLNSGGHVKQSMAIKEAEFFARIRKNRVDPASSSVQNPVPDFYGEKISSVAGYRRWLKDQRAFAMKRERGERPTYPA